MLNLRKKNKNTLIKLIVNKLKFIKIDFSFYFVLLLAILTNNIKIYFIYIVFLLLHEIMHYLVAKNNGYMAKRIRLSFFGASLEGLDDFYLNDEIKVVLAGPLFNFAIIILCNFCFLVFPASYKFLYDVFLVNSVIFLYNLLPIYPLDGGRLVLLLLNKKYIRKIALKFVKIISWIVIGLIFLIFLISFFVNYNFILGFICVNLVHLVLKSTSDTSYKRNIFVKNKIKLIERGLIEKNIYIDHLIDKKLLLKYIDDYHYINFIFINNSYEIVGSMNETELYKYLNIL